MPNLRDTRITHETPVLRGARINRGARVEHETPNRRNTPVARMAPVAHAGRIARNNPRLLTVTRAPVVRTVTHLRSCSRVRQNAGVHRAARFFAACPHSGECGYFLVLGRSSLIMSRVAAATASSQRSGPNWLR